MIAFTSLLQQTTGITDILKDYGWIGIIILLFFDKVWPTLQEHFSATHKRRVAQEDEERKARGDREARLATVLEQFSNQLQTFGLAMTVTTERLTSIERDQDAMRQALAILADRKQQLPQQRARGSAGD